MYRNDKLQTRHVYIYIYHRNKDYLIKRYKLVRISRTRDESDLHRFLERRID